MNRHLFLVGMPGSGKTRTGKAVARRLKLPFLDLDRQVERSEGMTILELFERKGEATFRRLEKAALERAAQGRPAVVSCGGGVVLDADNRALLRRSGTVVWLSVPLDKLARRAPSGGKRPLLRDPGDLERLLAEREPLYREVADVIVDGGRETDQTAESIVEAITWNE